METETTGGDNFEITEEGRGALDAFLIELDQWKSDIQAIDHGAHREDFFMEVKNFIRFIREKPNGDQLMHLLRASGRVEEYAGFFRWANGV